MKEKCSPYEASEGENLQRAQYEGRHPDFLRHICIFCTSQPSNANCLSKLVSTSSFEINSDTLRVRNITFKTLLNHLRNYKNSDNFLFLIKEMKIREVGVWLEKCDIKYKNELLRWCNRVSNCHAKNWDSPFIKHFIYEIYETIFR